MVSGINNIELWNQVKPELQNGEELLWVGKPMPLRVVLASSELISGLVGVVMIIIFFIVFSSFYASFRMPSSFNSSFNSPFSFFSLFPLIFVAVGAFTIGRPIYAFFMATRTLYGLTDQRALIITQTFSGKKVESYTESDQIERTEIANGKGDLVFDRTHTRYRRKGGYRVRTRKIGFFGIENVREVEAMMLRSLREREAAF